MRNGILKSLIILIFIMIGFVSISYGMTPEEEKRLFQLLGEIKGELVQVNRRIDDLNRRMNDLNRRINDLNGRIDDLREDMNARFEQVDKRFEQVDKRFEQVDKRFEETNKRIDETNANLRWLGLVMGGLVAAVIGIVVWDRRTAVRVAVKEAKREMEEDYELGLLPKILGVLREKAKSDRELAAILKNFGLL